MRITASDIAMESRTSRQQTREVREQLTAGLVRNNDTFSRENLVQGIHAESSQTQVQASTQNQAQDQISAQGRLQGQRQEQAQEERQARTEQDNDVTYEDIRKLIDRQDRGKYSFDQLLNRASDIQGSPLFQLDPQERVKLELMKSLFETITGKRFSVGVLDQQNSLSINVPTVSIATPVTDAQTTQAPTTSTQPSNALEFGAIFSRQETIRTEEQVQFATTGRVITADGQEIEIDLSLNLNRSRSQSQSLEIRVGAALKDPLVINFSGESSQLTERTYEFDLDQDGNLDRVHQLAESSGYIALDRNQNQQIDDGSELFGATTGNGFAELAAFDEDGNGFIDEGDTIFQQLRIWVQHNDGSQSLFTLAEQGVGALYLGYRDTAFELAAGDSNTLAGELRSTGIFLREDGSQGTLQQIDLVI